MYEETLREIGLSPNESRIYEAILALGEASVQELSIKSKVHRRNTYDSLGKLLEKGLVSEVFIRGEKNYRSINPNRLIGLLEEKKEKLNKILPKLETKFIGTDEKEEAYVYRGIQGFKNYFDDILKTKETVFFIGAKAMWLDPRLKHYLPRFQRERKLLGIKFMHIFDHEVKEKRPDILGFVGKPYKFFPKGYSSPTMVDIFGPYVTTFIGAEIGILPEEPITFVMKSKKLADGYRKFWQFMWDKL
jgi:predicted DNA-binding transcriptional regulator